MSPKKMKIGEILILKLQYELIVSEAELLCGSNIFILLSMYISFECRTFTYNPVFYIVVLKLLTSAKDLDASAITDAGSQHDSTNILIIIILDFH